jgi:hypothetical protein
MKLPYLLTTLLVLAILPTSEAKSRKHKIKKAYKQCSSLYNECLNVNAPIPLPSLSQLTCPSSYAQTILRGKSAPGLAGMSSRLFRRTVAGSN